jgi:hypothetical protein
MQKTKLLPPLPPFVDRNHPQVIAWRQDLHEQAIEHLHASKIESPNASLLRLTALVLTYVLGGIGLVSPQFAGQVLKLLQH